MILPLKGGGIRGFVVERGVVGMGAVGYVIYRNNKRTRGFDFGRFKSHGPIGTASTEALPLTTPLQVIVTVALATGALLVSQMVTTAVDL